MDFWEEKEADDRARGLKATAQAHSQARWGVVRKDRAVENIKVDIAGLLHKFDSEPSSKTN